MTGLQWGDQVPRQRSMWQKKRYLVVIYRIVRDVVGGDGHAQCCIGDRGGDKEAEEPVYPPPSRWHDGDPDVHRT
jgi:hypothetical protein